MKIEIDGNSTILGFVLGVIAIFGLGAINIIKENEELLKEKEEA